MNLSNRKSYFCRKIVQLNYLNLPITIIDFYCEYSIKKDLISLIKTPIHLKFKSILNEIKYEPSPW